MAHAILIANDDGYLAPGLPPRQACAGLGELDVVAPEQNASGTSNSLTLNRPLSVFTGGQRLSLRQRHAVRLRAPRADRPAGQRPDLVVSGINNGANMGDDTLYSGTVAAAMEGFLFGIPAIAFSQVDKGWAHLDAAARVARAGDRAGAAREPPDGAPWLLNVNIPNRADADSLPREVTRLGRRHASEPVIRADQPARRHDLLDRPGRRRARGRRRAPTSTPPPRAGVDHAAAGRPDRPRRSCAAWRDGLGSAAAA